MRVIAGSAKSIPLKTAKDLSIRPTADRVKEALFSALGSKIIASRVLDAFCGSGALGIEALSRGAKESVFVDISREAVSLCKENLARTRLDGKAKVVCHDLLTFLSANPEAFDLIFLDPPYAGGLYEPVLSAIHKNKLLNAGGIVVVEYEEIHSPVIPAEYEIIKAKRYGRVFLAFLELKG